MMAINLESANPRQKEILCTETYCIADGSSQGVKNFFSITTLLGVQLFGSFLKNMMLLQPSFEFATNWLLEVLWTCKKIAAINLPIQNRHILSPGLTLDIPGLANWWKRFFGGSEALPRISWWPIQNLVGAASWFFEKTQKVAPLLHYSILYVEHVGVKSSTPFGILINYVKQPHKDLYNCILWRPNG